MNRIRLTLPTIAAGIALALGGHTPAGAVSTQGAAPTPAGVTNSSTYIDRRCHVEPKRGVDAVRVRVNPTTNSAAIGQLNPGQRAPADCSATSGSTYTACGGTSKFWIGVNFAGRRGYVVQRCVEWGRD
jgi:hypothetical protein